MMYQNLIGIPYSPPEAPGQGLNCWQLAERVMREDFHLEPPVVECDLPARQTESVFLRHLSHWQQICPEERAPGDLVLLRIAGLAVHCGVLVERNRMVHSLERVGVCLSSLTDRRWARRVAGFYRWQ